jgi:hydroxyacylglutathione hydrolase
VLASPAVLFRQFVDDDLGCASYLIGDEEVHEAVLVDPAYAIEPYLEAAEKHEVEITCVLETHTHADHVSGHGRLALEHGIRVCVHPAANVDFPHEPLVDRAEIECGSLRVRVIHTPGHRPEHCSFLVDDAVLTGDSLFVGSIARPDLAVEATAGAEGLFHSLRRLMELPDGARVFPGHVAGSLCGAGMSSDPSSTIGHERRFNAALAVATVEEFIIDATSQNTPRPPNMERIVELNRGPFVGAAPPLGQVTDADGATVLDVRPPEAFADGHVPGALNVPVSGSAFGTKAGFVLRKDERIVLHASSPAEADVGAARLWAVGFLELGGYLLDPHADATLDPLGIAELERLLADGAIEVIDVREKDERDHGYIPGSRHVPYRLVRACCADIPHDRPIATVCESGARAAIAASILAARGYDARPVLVGGIPEWERRGNRIVEFRRCGAA